MKQTVDYVMSYLYKRLPLPTAQSSRKKRPRTPFSKDRDITVEFKQLQPTWYGYQYKRQIVLNTGRWTQLELIDTLAHEYRHIWQDMVYPGAYRWYKNRSKTGYYYHPMELDARAFAETILLEFAEDPNFPWWSTTDQP